MWKSIWDKTTSIASTVESEDLILDFDRLSRIPIGRRGPKPTRHSGSVSRDCERSKTTYRMSRRISPGSGIPINNRTKLTIEIVAGENSGTIIDGNLAVRNPPTDGFIVDDTYDPSTISGPVWLMYDRTTDSGGDRRDVYQRKPVQGDRRGRVRRRAGE